MKKNTIKATTIATAELLKQTAENVIEIPDFQRPEVWTAKDIKSLWETISKSQPLPSFIIGITPEGYRYLVDGQQRTKALSVLADIFTETGNQSALDFLNKYPLSIIEYTAEESVLADYFSRLNAKSGLSLSEKEKGKLPLPVQQVINAIIDNDSFYATFVKRSSIGLSAFGAKADTDKEDKQWVDSLKGLSDKALALAVSEKFPKLVSTSTSNNIKVAKAYDATKNSAFDLQAIERKLEGACAVIEKLNMPKVKNALIFTIWLYQLDCQTKTERTIAETVLRSLWTGKEMNASVNGVKLSKLADRDNSTKATQEKLALLNKIYAKRMEQVKKLKEATEQPACEKPVEISQASAEVLAEAAASLDTLVK